VIRKLFDRTRPLYLKLSNGRFQIGERQCETLDATLRDLVPVRKLFVGDRLECWSVNGARGRDRRLCAFCPDAARCQKRLRLLLILNGDDDPEQPVVLEVRAGAFADLDAALDAAGPDEAWRNALFRISTRIGPDGRDRLHFMPLF
jgi:hypothetical protein